MFLRFFKSSFVTQYFVIGIIGLFLWGRAFFQPPSMPLPDGPVPFYQLLYSLLSSFPILCSALGYLVTLLSGYLLNHILNRNELVTRNTSLAAFIFIILSGYYPYFLTLNPGLFSVFFAIIILARLFDSYSIPEPLDLLYTAGFFTGIASFFYFPFIFSFGTVLGCLIIFRSNSWRDWISAFIGLLTPYLFLAVYYYWFDQFEERAQEYIYYFKIDPDLDFYHNPLFMVLTSFILIIFLFTFIRHFSHRFERTIEIRRKNLVLNWMLFFIIISFPFAGHLSLYHILMMFITITFLLTSYLLHLKKNTWQEIVFLLFMLAILLNNLVIFYF